MPRRMLEHMLGRILKKDDFLLHLELSVCPSTHLGWTGLDWIHVK